MSRVEATTGPSTPSAQPTPPAPSATSSPYSHDQTRYPVKWVLNHEDQSVPIIMQSSNGPCALIALANTLLSTGHLKLSPGTTTLRESHLMSMLADEASSRAAPSETYAHALADFLDFLPSLSSGLHINVRFTDPTAFEFTRELSAFDVFPARLLHGWLVDPQDAPLASALGALTYNQVLNELVRTTSPEPADPSAPSPDDLDDHTHHPVDEAEEHEQNRESNVTSAIRELRPYVLDFFESNPTMLTVYGLAVLHDTMRENETAILFRNSHFYVLRKHNDELYTLVTDVGYLNELNTVWEKLMDVSGDSAFYTGGFAKIGSDGSIVKTRRQASSEPNASKASASAKGQSSASSRPVQTPFAVRNGRTFPPLNEAASSSCVPASSSEAAGRGRDRPLVGQSNASKKGSEKCVIQ